MKPKLTKVNQPLVYLEIVFCIFFSSNVKYEQMLTLLFHWLARFGSLGFSCFHGYSEWRFGYFFVSTFNLDCILPGFFWSEVSFIPIWWLGSWELWSLTFGAYDSDLAWKVRLAGILGYDTDLPCLSKWNCCKKNVNEMKIKINRQQKRQKHWP